MTSVPDRPQRRRRRARRPDADGPAEAGSPGPATGRPDAAAAVPAEPRPSRPGTARRRPDASDHGKDDHPHGRGDRQHGRDDRHGNSGGSGRDSERGWRELAGSSPSQVGTGGALRARDVARPTADDLAAAEQSVVLVRRGWQPPEG